MLPDPNSPAASRQSCRLERQVQASEERAIEQEANAEVIAAWLSKGVAGAVQLEDAIETIIAIKRQFGFVTHEEESALVVVKISLGKIVLL